MRRVVVACLLALALAGCGASPASAPATVVPAAVAPTLAPTAAPVPTLAPTEAPTAAPSDAPSAIPKPTSAPKPTAAPKPAASGPGLGISRAVLQSKFEGDPFNVTFADDPEAKDEPAVKGTSKAKGVTVHLRGAPENVQEAQIQAVFDEGATSDDTLRHMIALLEVAAPGIKNPTVWLEPHLNKALTSTTDTAIEGGRTITIIATQKPTIIILSVLPAS
jgi:hypothetical protein